jgi:hypothetical protein
MAITTLLAFWIDRKTKADAAVADALVALTTAQTELTTQRSKLAIANAELASIAKDTAKIRADLAEAATPADVDALTPKLATAIRETRAKQAAILAVEAAIDSAQTELDLKTAGAARAASRASAAAAALEAGDQDKDRTNVAAKHAVRASNSVTIGNLTDHPFLDNDAITVSGMTDASFNGTFTIGSVTATSITYPQTAADAVSGGGVVFGLRALRLRHALAKPPLSTMMAAAAAALAAKPWTDARARIQADLPTELRDCAKERARVQSEGVKNQKRKVDETVKLRAASIADADNHRRLFEAADAAFRDYVAGARNRFDQALAIAVRIADLKQNPLTAAENASIHSQKPDGSTDAALQNKRNDAAGKAKDVATAQIDVDAKQTDVDIARVSAQATDIDLADPSTDPAVKAAQGLLDTSNTSLNTAKTAFTTDMKDDLASWETAVPDTAWRNLADFEAAKRLLVGLQADDPGPLVTTLDTAEADLVAALIAAEKADRTRAFLDSEVTRLSSQARFDAGSLPRRELGALRGDS